MSHDRSHDSHGERKSTQALAKIQHSRANDEKQARKPKRKAAVVADPRNRLANGSVDPVTEEVKPAGE